MPSKRNNNRLCLQNKKEWKGRNKSADNNLEIHENDRKKKQIETNYPLMVCVSGNSFAATKTHHYLFISEICRQFFYSILPAYF